MKKGFEDWRSADSMPPSECALCREFNRLKHGI